MTGIESLLELFGRTAPRLWAMELESTQGPGLFNGWAVELRIYHVENSHAANISAEVADVLGLAYVPERGALRARTVVRSIAARAVIRQLSAVLYGDREYILARRLD